MYLILMHNRAKLWINPHIDVKSLVRSQMYPLEQSVTIWCFSLCNGYCYHRV
jgi:hypothetical protein